MVKQVLHKINTDQSLKKLLSGSGLVLIFKLGAALGSYFFYLFLSQQYGATTVGEFNVAFTIVSLGGVLARLGLDGAMVKLVPRGIVDQSGKAIKNLVRKLLLITFASSLILALLAYLSRFWIAELLENQNLIVPVSVSALLLIPYTLCIMVAEVYRSIGKNQGFSLMQQGSVYLLMAVLGLFFADTLQLSFYQVLYVFLGLFTAQLILGGMTLPKLLNQIPQEKAIEFGIKEVFRLAWPMFLSGSAVLLMSWTDTLILAYFETEDLVGIYGIAFKVATLVTIVQFALNTVAAPMISKFHKQQNFKALEKFIQQITWLNLAVAFPTLLVFCFFGEWFLGLFGAEFGAGKQVLVILSFGQLLNAMSGPVMLLLNMTAYEIVARNTILISALINIILNILLIPLLGIIGAAIASSAVMMVWNLVGVLMVKQKLGFWTCGLIKSR